MRQRGSADWNAAACLTPRDHQSPRPKFCRLAKLGQNFRWPPTADPLGLQTLQAEDRNVQSFQFFTQLFQYFGEVHYPPSITIVRSHTESNKIIL